MNHRKIVLLLLLILMAGGGCSDDESIVPVNPGAANNQPLGTSAEDILSEGDFTKLTIELVYTNSFRPEPSSVLGFQNFINGLTFVFYLVDLKVVPMLF